MAEQVKLFLLRQLCFCSALVRFLNLATDTDDAMEVLMKLLFGQLLYSRNDVSL